MRRLFNMERGKLALEVSHTLLAALCLLPFLMPLHTMPIGSFYAEWLALLLGLLAFPVLLAVPDLRLPKIALLPLGAAALILVQRILQQPAYGEVAMIAVLYLLWAAYLMLIAANIAAVKGVTATVQRLAWWLLAGSLTNAVVVFAFALSPLQQYLLLRPMPPGNIFLAQANHLADYLWLGIATALYLYRLERLRGWQLTLCAGLLVCGSALTSSRASLAYAACLVCLVFIGRLRRLYRPVLAIAGVYLILLLGLPHLGLGDGSNALTRLMGDMSTVRVHGASIRLQLIQSGWLSFLDQPWLGNGFGSFAVTSFAHAEIVSGWQGTAEHAHQLFVSLLSELGFFAPLALAGALLWWGRLLWRQRAQQATLWLAAVAGIIFLHAQVEYPLWYAFFLGLFAVVLALPRQGTLPLHLPRWLWLIVPCLGLSLLVSIYSDYLKLEKWTYADAMLPPGALLPPNYYQPLLAASHGSLLRPWMEMRIAMQMPASQDHLQDKLNLCKNTLALTPSTPTVFSCALIYAYAGKREEAQLLWQRGETVFSAEAVSYRRVVLPQLTPEMQKQYTAISGRRD